MSHTASHPPRSNLTKFLHLTLLLMVVHQLIGSNFIRMPIPGDAPKPLFVLHEYLGIAGLGLIGLFWLWVMIRRGETRLGRLVPWFSGAAMRAVGSDLATQLRQIIHLSPPDDEDGALASAVHGLGLLLMTVMAITGTVYFFTLGTPVAHPLLIAHKLLAKLSWAYLIAHAGLAVIHHLLGSDIFARMFWVRSRAVRPVPPSPTR